MWRFSDENRKDYAHNWPQAVSGKYKKLPCKIDYNLQENSAAYSTIPSEGIVTDIVWVNHSICITVQAAHGCAAESNFIGYIQPIFSEIFLNFQFFSNSGNLSYSLKLKYRCEILDKRGSHTWLVAQMVGVFFHRSILINLTLVWASVKAIWL